uniref:Uncharacterized protein n=1 Tax=Varanus komodoensis TaxID=61221 RepID=A0A8D2J9K4_VARKO
GYPSLRHLLLTLLLPWLFTSSLFYGYSLNSPLHLPSPAQCSPPVLDFKCHQVQPTWTMAGNAGSCSLKHCEGTRTGEAWPFVSRCFSSISCSCSHQVLPDSGEGRCLCSTWRSVPGERPMNAGCAGQARELWATEPPRKDSSHSHKSDQPNQTMLKLCHVCFIEQIIYLHLQLKRRQGKGSR